MRQMLRDLVHHRELLYMLTWKEIRIRYKQSVMGFAWAILMPVLIVASGLVIKKLLSVVSGQPLRAMDVLSVTVKALPWAFFIGGVRFGTNSLVSNSNLVSKIYFPREILPFAAVTANLFDTAVAAAFLIPVLALVGVGASIYLLWLPLLVLLLILFTVALALLLSCANLFFRDVKYLVEIVLTFGILFTPVFYEASRLGEWAPVLLLNPVAALLEAINSVVVLRQAPDLFWVGYAAVWAVGGLLASWLAFERAEPLFAECI